MKVHGLIFAALLLITSGSALAQSFHPTRDPNQKTFYGVTRLCRFSPWGKSLPKADWLIKALSVVTIYQDDLENWLPLVVVDVRGESLMGFMDRRCLDPGPLQKFEYDNLNGDPNKFVNFQISPSLQEVIQKQLDPRLLSFEPAPLNQQAMTRVIELQKNSQKWVIDVEALAELSQKDSLVDRIESLSAFLTSSKIELGDLIGFRDSGISQENEIRRLGGDSLLAAYGELSNAKTPNCARARNGFRLFFATGMNLSDPDQVLAVFSLMYSDDPQIMRCRPEVEEARILLNPLGLAKPASPYQVDQVWKRTWGLATDDQIKAAFPGKKVKIIRDDGDINSEKRIISEVVGFGILEQYAFNKNGQSEFRWIKSDLKTNCESTGELRRKLKRLFN